LTFLSVSSVSKSYNEKDVQNVLSAVSFELGRGEFCTLLGPSGSGKTTLLNIIAGLDQPDEGQVILEDRRIDLLDESKKAKLRAREIGIAFQNPNLVAHLNVLENVLLPTLFANGEQDEDDRRARAVMLLKSLNMENKMRQVPSKLSDGEKRRASVARALIARPKLILADEPTINLDSDNKDAVLDLLKASTEEGAATLVATHDEDVSKFAHKTLRIKFGKLC
jgi:ABC-type lipoprotein export system ATPase subunit